MCFSYRISKISKRWITISRDWLKHSYIIKQNSLVVLWPFSVLCLNSINELCTKLRRLSLGELKKGLLVLVVFTSESPLLKLSILSESIDLRSFSHLLTYISSEVIVNINITNKDNQI